MPRRKTKAKTKRGRKKRTSGLSKYTKLNQGLSIQKGLIGLNRYVAMPFSEMVELFPGSVAHTKATYSVNDIFSHQPYGHDQYIVYFNRYKVHHATYDIQFVNDGTLSTPICVGVTSDKAGLLPNSLYTKIERFGRNNCKVMPINSNAPMARFKGSVNFKRYIGTDGNLGDDNYQANANNSPNYPISVSAWSQALDQSTSAGNGVQVLINILFYVEWMDPVDVLGSH